MRRLRALCAKESRQIVRDPSSIIIAFVLPVVLLFIYSYGISLDATGLRIGLLVEDPGVEARRFADTLHGTPYLDVAEFRDRAALEQSLVDNKIRGFVLVQPDFTRRLRQSLDTAPILVVTDGSEPNLAPFVENYTRGAWQGWLQSRADDLGLSPAPPIRIEAHYWYNPAAQSRNFIIPGAITGIMTVIGVLLTSLVIAREWERGTMEALLATPVTRTEFLLSKIIPYYILGVISMFLCVAVARYVLGVPFRGSLGALMLVTTLFLTSALGMGLMISTLTRNQFTASQAALNGAFLPALMLSGFIYEIRSMPPVIQGICHLVPAKYFVTAMQTLFMAGDLWSVLIHNLIFLAAVSFFFLGVTALKTRRRLE
jgi:ABC-2 type transport system permease protein